MGTKPQGRNVQPVFITGGDPLGPGIPVTVVVTPVPNPTVFTTQQLNVASAGTAQQLGSAPLPDGFKFVVKAKDGNTQKIYVGFSKADAEDHTAAFILSASQGLIFTLHDPAEVWIDADVNGEGVVVATIAEYSGGGGGGGGSAPANRSAIANDQLDVAIPGTAQQFQTQAIPNGFQIFLRAKISNNANIYVAGSQADAQNHAKATILEPGAFLEYGITNADIVWIDADTATDGVMWTVEI